MANIALLNRCNLRCPYCFADSYLGSEGDDLKIDTLMELLDFCADEGTIGLIGGEPLLHKQIDTILEILKQNMWYHKVTIFTNGIFLDRVAPSLNHPKFHLLINVNSKKDIGEKAFSMLEKGIEEALKYLPLQNVDLGINVYEENQDFSSLLYLLEKFNLKKLRVSLVIPKDKREGGIPYFYRMKKTLLSLYEKIKTLGVCPGYDCNAIPECVFTEEERAFLDTLSYENQFEREIFTGKRSVCSPVVDIYPDKTATRCFGMYDRARVSITDFKSLNDLKNYFFKEVDCRIINNYPQEKCKDCYKNKTFGCFGGCLCYL
ncbi:MAG: radical SAM protein [Clostridia bacterium]|nr:radical SAM protein [Clostridia bacterium]